MRSWLSILCVFLVCSLWAQDRPLVTVHKALELMGSRFDITVVAHNEDVGYINIDEATAEIQRIEKLISAWDPDSETSLINKNAGIRPVVVSAELFALIERSKQISELTDGAFDISYASMDGIWKFDGSMTSMPSQSEIKNSIAKVGYRNIVLNHKEQSVFLAKKGMKISFGAIGKGYAADKAKELLVSKQVVGGIINAAGDLTTWGTKANGEKWLIGIANPLSEDRIFSWLPIVESSVATSGNYEKHVVLDGVKYSHIIDPRTGYPATGVNSVSIFAKSAETCDALATAVFILGKEDGLALVNQLGGIEVVLVDDRNKIHKSSGILLDEASE
ncbi:FAD:protein FMN transferase [Pseudozobellia thermophila]|uniref:FAD:protein FMN transferase n=1 Tax=Pseudozobellia thermophila TaxID=192903 RepID=A0A1M6HNN8_9FLAO|nr:FAD:protein FMN transferase [Pseudozobellia thermophila]SHJ23809.1 thiamine biosynthesis lipoprotein [Pseudozobellia thermophila]